MEYMEKILKKTGLVSIIESLVIAILGLILALRPEGTLNVISNILGIIFIIAGIYKIINYILTKGKYDLYNFNLIYGLMAIVIGIVTIIYSSTIVSIFRIIIGIWIIYSSFIRMSVSIKLKRVNPKIWGYSLFFAIIMFICGIYIISNSGTIVATIGIMMIISSILDITEDIIFMKNIKQIL